MRGLQALSEEKKVKTLAIVSRDPIRRRAGGIEIYPWKEFLEHLWKESDFFS